MHTVEPKFYPCKTCLTGKAIFKYLHRFKCEANLRWNPTKCPLLQHIVIIFAVDITKVKCIYAARYYFNFILAISSELKYTSKWSKTEVKLQKYIWLTGWTRTLGVVLLHSGSECYLTLDLVVLPYLLNIVLLYRFGHVLYITCMWWSIYVLDIFHGIQWCVYFTPD